MKQTMPTYLSTPAASDLGPANAFSRGVAQGRPCSAAARRTRLRPRCIGRTLTSTVLLFVISGRLHAGPVPALSDGAVASQTLKTRLPKTEEEIDHAIDQVEARLKEARAKASPGPPANAVATASLAGTPDELAERDQSLQQWLIALDQHARYLRNLKEIRRNNQERAVEQEAWRGFTEAPTAALAERLRDEISAHRLEYRTGQMLLSILQGEISRCSARLEQSQKQLRLVLDQPAIDGDQAPRRQWRIQLAQARNQANEASVETAEVGRLTTWQALDGQSNYIQFLERKLMSSRTLAPLTRVELDRVLAQIREKRAALHSELNEAIAIDRELRSTHDAAPGATRGPEHEGAAVAPSDAEVTKARLDASRRKVEALHGFLQLTDYARAVWEDRLWASEPRSLRQLRERQRHHEQLLDGLRQWKALLEQSLAAVSEQMLRHTLGSEDSRLPVAQREAAARIRKTLQERAWTELRAIGALVFTEDLTARLHAELSERMARISLAGRIHAVLADLSAVIGRLWGTELYIAEDSVIAGGQKVSIPRSITLGKVFTALTIFACGLLLARWIYQLTHRLGTRRAAGPAAAEVPAKAMATLVALGSLLVAMASVRIPWTVFAFLGGALAIGVGFGAQALINNFISGIILLCERSIRVGDIVEVDEQRGKVVRVGFRNSLVVRGDGIEVLVPNSQFLEKKVVNWTLSNDLVRYEVSVGVAYGASPTRVTELIAQAAAEHPHVIKTPAPEVLLEDFGDNAVVFTLEFWMRLTPSVGGGRVRSQLRHRIYELFTEAGISIAFPQRDIHLDANRPLEIKLVGAARADHIEPGPAKEVARCHSVMMGALRD
jgi:small-conductance mechanosensitive channel